MVSAADKKRDTSIYGKIEIIYNGFSNKNGRGISERIKTFGGFPRYENTKFENIVDTLSGTGVFQPLLEEMEEKIED